MTFAVLENRYDNRPNIISSLHRVLSWQVVFTYICCFIAKSRGITHVTSAIASTAPLHNPSYSQFCPDFVAMATKVDWG